MKRRVSVGHFEVDDGMRKAVLRVLDSGRVSEGRETRAFENAFSAFVGTSHCVALNSGTSALIAGMVALRRIREEGGDGVDWAVTTPLTYAATANAIVLSGMEPLFADVEPETFSLHPDRVEEALESKGDQSGMVVPVHLMGYMCDMPRFRSIANRRDLELFEDASQAHGSYRGESPAGSWGHASSFSFYIAHNIQAGELGAVCTDDREVARRVRKIKANGRVCDCAVCTRPDGKCPKFRDGKRDWDPRFLHDEVGYNFKTTEFSAAIANAQLEAHTLRDNEIARKRRANVKVLNDLLSRHSSVLRLPLYSDDVSYLGYPLVIRDPGTLNRERLQLALEAEGVETRPLFGCIPIHQPAYAHLRKRYQGKLPNAEYAGANGFYIGCHQYLTREDMEHVADAFAKAVNKVSR
ncbi:MAG: DegT/DnrJ/EryC1/StrS family aminotransferase [Candidatus Thermoplasmatota archaeon]